MQNESEALHTIRSGQAFSTCYERCARLIMTTCAPWDGDAAHAEAYALMLRVYRAFEAQHSSMGLTALPDVSFGQWEQQKGRENDVKAIRGAMDKIMGFEGMLLSFLKVCEQRADGLYAKKSDVKLRPLFFRVLDAAEIPYQKGAEIALLLAPACAGALAALSRQASRFAMGADGAVLPDRELLFFSRIVFDDTKDWLIDGFDAMMNAEGELKSLCHELEKRGFYRQVYVDGRRLTLNYLKNYAKKPGPLKMSFGERSRLGIEISLEDIRLAPAVLSLRLPFYANVLRSMKSLSPSVRSFALRHTKNCDGCRCCVRTDKTRTKPFAAMEIEGESKCPLYPSFSYSFTALPEAEKNAILSLFDEIMGLKAFQTKAENA